MPSSLGKAGEVILASSQSNQPLVELFGCDENGKCIINVSGEHDRGKDSKCWIFRTESQNCVDNLDDADLLLSSTVAPQPITQSTTSCLNDDSFAGWDDDEDDDILTAVNIKEKVSEEIPARSVHDEESDLDEPIKKRGLNSDQVRELLERDDPPPDVDHDDILNADIDLNDDDMDVGRIKAEYLAKIALDDIGDMKEASRDKLTKKEVEELLDNVPKAIIQKPIQPGASPEEDNNRFLCWNATGIIRAQYGDDQCIDVMFHDTEKHSSVNFRNEPNYSFGSLSDDVIVMGTNGKYGTGPAAVFGINLQEIDRDQREWQINLPHVELIEGLAAGTGFVAVVTDKRYLRLLTHGGMQSYVMSLPGQILCMNAHEQQLLIVYHNGAGHPDEQNLSLATYHIDLFNNKIIQTMNDIPVALSKRSPLAWAGFSDEGVPATSDYHGVVRLYKEDIARSWHPVLDFRELSSSALDHYFVVGVSELRNGVRAVRCSKSRYPDQGQDIAAFYNFTLPFCDMDSQKVQLEEEHARLRLARSSYDRLGRQGSHLRRVAAPYIESNVEELAGTILKLFSIYLNDSKEEAAKNLVSLMPKEYVYKLPEYAWHTKRRSYFIDSLNKAIEERERYDADNDEDFTDVHHADREDDLEEDSDKNSVLRPKPLKVLKDRQDFTLGPNGQLLRKKRKNVDDDEDDAEIEIDCESDQGDEDTQVDENINNDDTDGQIVKKTKTVSRIANSTANSKSNPFKRKK